MLSHEDNALLTQVGPGTVMGNFLRQFWLPLLPSQECPPPGERPLRMKLLGEDLVVFRNKKGKIGLLREYCAHRGASLFYGRNEGDGVRCVYHGWLYDVDGRCLAMPNEPVESTFKERVRQRAYPCHEENGTVWTYMGPRIEPPPLPQYGLLTAPASHKYHHLYVRDCNWVQALEGDLDLSHGAYLHSAEQTEFLGQNHLDRFTGEKPHLEALDTAYGECHAVRRDYDGENYHWGIAQFLFPFIVNFPPVGDGVQTVPGHVWVPMDDHTTLVWQYRWNPAAPLHGGGAPERSPMFDHEWEEYLPATPEAGGRWRVKANRENDFGFDPVAQGTKRFSGLPTVSLQDQGLQTSMGPVVDRSEEHLGTTDVPLIRTRRRLLRGALALRDEGLVPECVEDGSHYRVRSASGILPKDVPWQQGAGEWIEDRPGTPIHSKGHLPMEAVSQLTV